MGRDIKTVVLLSVFWSIAFLGGCGQYNVSIDSINDGQAMAKGVSFCILSGMEEVDDNDLRFTEFSACVGRALEIRGYVGGVNRDSAKVIVLLSYGMEEPREYTYGYPGPYYDDAGFSSATTFGEVKSHGKRGSTYSETTVYSGSHYGFGGRSGIVNSYVEYTCFANITAYDGAEFRTDRREPLWETDVVSTGSISDMRRVFPVMIGAATAYLGGNTGEQTVVVVDENDEVVKIVKGQPD